MATLTSTHDAVLSRRLRERDHSAWEELYAAHGPQLRAFALRLARDPHEADDLVQETFVRALPRLDRLNLDEIALRPYLFTTLRNTFLKNCDRRRRVAPVEEVPEPATPGALEDDPERSLLLHGQIEEIRLATASLAPRQRLALALRELEDCSYAEIAAIVGIKENAVAQLISRARDSLRNTLRLAQVDTADLPDACRRMLPQLSRHLDRQLRGDQLERILVHLDACEHCQHALEAMGEASRRYRGLLPPLVLTEDAHAAAIDAELTAAGFWEARPTRRSWGRSRPATRSWRRSRRVAVLTTAALLLGGGGALVLALPAPRSDRMASGDRLAASAGLGTASAGGQATAPSASSGVGGPRSSANGAGAPGRGDASISSASRPRMSSSRRLRAGRAAPTGVPAAAAGTRGSSEPAASVSPGRAGTGAKRAPAAGPKTGARGSRPAGGSAPPATTGSSTGTGAGTDSAPDARSGPAAGPDTAPRPDPAPGADPTPRRAADTTPPTTSITAVFTSADKARFSFTASETGATFACALDAGGFEPCTNSKSFSGLSAGRHSFSVRATDSAGNTGAADQHAWTVVEALPDLVIAGFTETSVTVANVGSAPSGAFVLSVSLVGSVTFGGLAPGARATHTFACRSGALTATADPGNSIAESNEANNRRDFDSRC